MASFAYGNTIDFDLIVAYGREGQRLPGSDNSELVTSYIRFGERYPGDIDLSDQQIGFSRTSGRPLGYRKPLIGRGN